MQKVNTSNETKRFEYGDTMSSTARVVILLGGLLPLLAPYELLYKPNWQSYTSVVFGVFFVISLGAVLLSVGVCLLALRGETWNLRFDRRSRTVIYRGWSPITGPKENIWPFDKIGEVTVEKVSETDGADYYQLRFSAPTGRVIIFGRFDSASEAELEQRALDALVHPQA